MPDLTAFDYAFLRLALHINHHINGYVDAYIGPPALKAEVEAAQTKPVGALRADLAWLQDNIPPDDAQRRRYLQAMLRAIGGTLQLLSGEPLDYLDEVETLYDVRPDHVDEARFEAAHETLADLLPGTGDVASRMQAWRAHHDLDADRLLDLLEMARRATRERTSSLVELVPGETMDVRLTSEQPWGAYNWYLGDARSLIEFNTDVPINALAVLSTFAHEGYPGHHTEGILKEQHLYKGKGYGENAILLLHSPAAVISEGIATTAVEIIFPGDEALRWTYDRLLPTAGIEPLADLDTAHAIGAALKALRYVVGNAALLHHGGDLDAGDTITYIMRYALTNRARAEKSFAFITNPLFRSYIFTYTEGYDLIAHAAADDKQALFKRLLVDQVLPSQLSEG